MSCSELKQFENWINKEYNIYNFFNKIIEGLDLYEIENLISKSQNIDKYSKCLNIDIDKVFYNQQIKDNDFNIKYLKLIIANNFFLASAERLRKLLIKLLSKAYFRDIEESIKILEDCKNKNLKGKFEEKINFEKKEIKKNEDELKNTSRIIKKMIEESKQIVEEIGEESYIKIFEENTQKIEQSFEKLNESIYKSTQSIKSINNEIKQDLKWFEKSINRDLMDLKDIKNRHFKNINKMVEKNHRKTTIEILVTFLDYILDLKLDRKYFELMKMIRIYRNNIAHNSGHDYVNEYENDIFKILEGLAFQIDKFEEISINYFLNKCRELYIELIGEICNKIYDKN